MTVTEIIPGRFFGRDVLLEDLSTTLTQHNITFILYIGPTPALCSSFIITETRSSRALTPNSVLWKRFKRLIIAGRVKWIEYEPHGCSTENLLHSMDAACEFIENALSAHSEASRTADTRHGKPSNQPEYKVISKKLRSKVAPDLPSKEDFLNWYALPMMGKFKDCNLWDDFMALNPPLDLQQAATNPSHPILVQCEDGMSASSAIIAAYIMRKQRICLSEALLKIAERLPGVKIHENLVGQLRLWEEMGYTKWFDRSNLLIQSRCQAFLIKHYDFLKARGFTPEQICKSMRYRRYIQHEIPDGLENLKNSADLNNRLRLIPDEEPKKLLMDRRADRWSDADLDEGQTRDRGVTDGDDMFRQFEAIVEARESTGDDKASLG